MNLRMPFFVVSFTFASLARLVKFVGIGAGANSVSDFVPSDPVLKSWIGMGVIACTAKAVKHGVEP